MALETAGLEDRKHALGEVDGGVGRTDRQPAKANRHRRNHAKAVDDHSRHHRHATQIEKSLEKAPLSLLLRGVHRIRPTGGKGLERVELVMRNRPLDISTRSVSEGAPRSSLAHASGWDFVTHDEEPSLARWVSVGKRISRVYNSATNQSGARTTRSKLEDIMPYTVNGIGTTYYGKKNLKSYQGRCEFCKRDGATQEYETIHWFVVVYVPIIPLGRKQILKLSNCAATSTASFRSSNGKR